MQGRSGVLGTSISQQLVWHAWPGTCVAGGRGHEWQGDVHGQEACMAWGIHSGRGHVWQRACVAEGMCGRGHVWQGACMMGSVHGRGMCDEGMAEKMATAVGSMHPTGMHSCFCLMVVCLMVI